MRGGAGGLSGYVEGGGGCGADWERLDAGYGDLAMVFSPMRLGQHPGHRKPQSGMNRRRLAHVIGPPCCHVVIDSLLRLNTMLTSTFSLDDLSILLLQARRMSRRMQQSMLRGGRSERQPSRQP